MDVEGSGTNLIQRYPGICLEEQVKPRDASVCIACAPAEIRTGHLTNTGLKRRGLSELALMPE
jgi:hypothetical protein